jgi:hypothetical protein
MGELVDRKPPALFPSTNPGGGCVCCRINTATSTTDGTCDQCSRILSHMASRKLLEQQEVSVSATGNTHQEPPVEDIFQNDQGSVDASSLRLSGASYLCQQQSRTPPPPSIGTSLPDASVLLSPLPGGLSVVSDSPSSIIDSLLASQSSLFGYGSTLRNHGFRLVVDWGLTAPGTNIPSILANFVLPPGVTAAVPKRFFTDDPTMMLQDFSLLRNQFVAATIEQQVVLFQHEIILVKAAFNRIIRDFMKLSMLKFARLHLSSTSYTPVTRLSNLDDLEVEFKSNSRPNWLDWFNATKAHHLVLWRKGRSLNCNLDLITMRAMELMGIDYRVNSNGGGGGCFRRAATRVFHNLSTHLKVYAALYQTRLEKVTSLLPLLCVLAYPILSRPSLFTNQYSPLSTPPFLDYPQFS